MLFQSLLQHLTVLCHLVLYRIYLVGDGYILVLKLIQDVTLPGEMPVQ